MSFQRLPKIRVVVRKRPLSKKEEAKGETDIVAVDARQTVLVRQHKLKVDLTPYVDDYKFNFDAAYPEHTTNEQIYQSSVKPLVQCAFDGARVSCFAYGQTGSGKTYTMLGDAQSVKGLYLLAAEEIFNLKQQIFRDLEVTISFYEIYCGKLYDLLNERSLLFAREDARGDVNIVGLSERSIHSVQQIVDLIEFGGGIRVTAQNGTNLDSSRSHAILQILLKRGSQVHGKISFIDLAGSERAADHADQLLKQTRIDGAEINKSLLALKQCIRALDQGKNHTPFRGSKLTMVLRDSFTGYCRTLMIGNVSPNSSSCENTLNTLKYADRVKELKKPKKQSLEEQDKMTREMMMPRSVIPEKRMSQQNPVISQKNSEKARHSQEEKPKVNNFMIKPNVNGSPKKANPLQNYFSTKGSPAREKALSFNFNSSSSGKRPTTSFKKEEPFDELARRHEQGVQRLILEEEELMLSHEAHINLTIEMVKRETALMSEADKIGSDMEEYLRKLDSLLEKEIQSIAQVQAKVALMKRHLKDSQLIEREYLQRSEQRKSPHKVFD